MLTWSERNARPAANAYLERCGIVRLTDRSPGEISMFLGTPRRWWIAAALPFVLGLVLLVAGPDGTLSTIGGLLLVLLAMVLFGMAPMRYGRGARTSPRESTAPTPPSTPIAASAPSRPPIEGRDASEV